MNIIADFFFIIKAATEKLLNLTLFDWCDQKVYFVAPLVEEIRNFYSNLEWS